MINNIRKLFLIVVLFFFAGCGQKNETNISDSTEIRMDTEKEKITLCSGAYGNYLKNLVSAYNQESKHYEIIVQTAGENEDVQTFRTRIQAELTAGKGADLLDVYALQNLDYIPYAQKGMLYEVSELIQEIGEIPENVKACNQWERGIYGVPTSFHMVGLSYVQDLNISPKTWTAQECMKVVEESKAPYFYARSKYMDTVDAGNYVLNLLGVGKQGIQLFIDEETGTCSFDTPEFKKILEFAKIHLDSGATENDSSERLLNGETIFSDILVGSFRSFWEISFRCQGREQYIGYPSPNGEVYGIMARSLFINVRTEHLEGVKDFLRYALSEKQQEKMVYEMDGYFPARQDVLKRLWKEAESELRDTGYTTDLSGNKLYEPRLMTKEEEQIFWHMLDCSVPSSYMNVINNIICEETALFFTDKKDADQVASSIQSRVQNYLNEEK